MKSYRRARKGAIEPVRRFLAGDDWSILARSDLIEFDGTVTKVANGTYTVECGGNHVVMARLKKRLKRFRIRVVLGDDVVVAVSPYDPTRGFITLRR